MGFTHARVTEIESATKYMLAKWVAYAENAPPIPMVDGIPVMASLATFCAEIRKANRHIKFGVGRSVKYRLVNSDNVAQDIYAYMDGHTYAMMKIGYGDYSVKGNGGSKYMVYARMINNDKFREDSDQYHMATADALDRAMKNAKKYMRPYTPVECASMSFSEMRGRFTTVVSGVSNELRAAKDSLCISPHLRAELFHMLDMGYEFLSEDFRDMIIKWRGKYTEDQVARGRALHAYYVNVRIHREEMVCDVVEVLDATKRSRLDDTMPVVTYKMEDLPDHIGGGLAALSMVDDNHYVDGVGLRIDGSTFWVQR